MVAPNFSKMTISAVIPTYNRAGKVCRAIDSVLAQSFPADEIIVVDDGSGDGTGDLISERYGDRVKVVVHERNLGISGARRTGFAAASGEWIAYLDSDDWWSADAIASLRAAASRCGEETVVVFGDMRIVNGNEAAQCHFTKCGFALDGPVCLLDCRTVIHPVMHPYFQSSLIRRSTLRKAHVFDEGLRIGEDSLAFAQLANQGRFVAIPDVTCFHDRTGDAGPSLHANLSNPDFFMSRMLAIREFNREGWTAFDRQKYAGWVRGWIRSRQRRGQHASHADLCDQFRYGREWKSWVFTIIALLRNPFLRSRDCANRNSQPPRSEVSVG